LDPNGEPGDRLSKIRMHAAQEVPGGRKRDGRSSHRVGCGDANRLRAEPRRLDPDSPDLRRSEGGDNGNAIRPGLGSEPIGELRRHGQPLKSGHGDPGTWVRPAIRPDDAEGCGGLSA
jgi:hypothetical protein